jgi:hypothetical protein
MPVRLTAFFEKGEPLRERSPQHSVSTKGLGPCSSQPGGPFSAKTALVSHPGVRSGSTLRRYDFGQDTNLPLEGAPKWRVSVLAERFAQEAHLLSGLFEHRKYSAHFMQAPDDYDHKRLEEESVWVEARPALLSGRVDRGGVGRRSIRLTSWTRTESQVIIVESTRVACLDTRHTRGRFDSGHLGSRYHPIYDRPSPL